MQTYTVPAAFEVGGAYPSAYKEQDIVMASRTGQSIVANPVTSSCRAANSMPVTQGGYSATPAASAANLHYNMPTTVYNPGKASEAFSQSTSTVLPTTSEAGYNKTQPATGAYGPASFRNYNGYAANTTAYPYTTPAVPAAFSATPTTAAYNTTPNTAAYTSVPAPYKGYNVAPATATATNPYANAAPATATTTNHFAQPVYAQGQQAAVNYINPYTPGYGANLMGANGYNTPYPSTTVANGYNTAYPNNMAASTAYPQAYNQNGYSYPGGANTFPGFHSTNGGFSPMGQQYPPNPHNPLMFPPNQDPTATSQLSQRNLPFGQMAPTAPCDVPVGPPGPNSHDERVMQLAAVHAAEVEAERQETEATSENNSPKPFCACGGDAAKSAQEVGSTVYSGAGQGLTAVKQFGEVTSNKAKELDEQYKIRENVKYGLQTSGETIAKGWQWTTQTIKETDEKYQISTKVTTTAQSVGKTVYEKGQQGWQAATKPKTPTQTVPPPPAE